MSRKILYVNACVRQESRTDRLARALLARLGAYEELKTDAPGLAPLSEERLNRRTELLAAGRFDDPAFDAAHRFADADVIVIGAPYWDGSFPSSLKVFLENIYAVGIVSAYGEDGRPVGLCRAEKLYYVTTAGGPFSPAFGFDYLSHLAKTCFGIRETALLCAEYLDVAGSDPEAILEEAIRGITL